MKRIKGSVMLLLAAFFWGTTFAAQSSATDNIQTFTFNAARSFVGAAFLGIIILIRKKRRGKEPVKITEDHGNLPVGKSVAGAGAMCGLVLFAAMSFQQSGISAYPDGVAASGRSGFLTATYVVMVAICARFQGKKLHGIVYAAVAVCLGGCICSVCQGE